MSLMHRLRMKKILISREGGARLFLGSVSGPAVVTLVHNASMWTIMPNMADGTL